MEPKFSVLLYHTTSFGIKLPVNNPLTIKNGIKTNKKVMKNLFKIVSLTTNAYIINNENKPKSTTVYTLLKFNKRTTIEPINKVIVITRVTILDNLYVGKKCKKA